MVSPQCGAAGVGKAGFAWCHVSICRRFHGPEAADCLTPCQHRYGTTGLTRCQEPAPHFGQAECHGAGHGRGRSGETRKTEGGIPAPGDCAATDRPPRRGARLPQGASVRPLDRGRSGKIRFADGKGGRGSRPRDFFEKSQFDFVFPVIGQ